MVRLLACSPQLAYCPAKGLYFVPIGEVDVRIERCRTLGHPHDEADHGSIPESVYRVVNLAAEYADHSRLPADRLEKLPDVGIGARQLFLRLACHGIDREERSVLRLNRFYIISNKLCDLRAVLAVANARPDHDLIEWFQIDVHIGLELQ